MSIIDSVKRDINREIDAAKRRSLGSGHPKVAMAADRMEHLLKYIEVLEREHAAFLNFTKHAAYNGDLLSREDATSVLKEQGYDIK